MSVFGSNTTNNCLVNAGVCLRFYLKCSFTVLLHLQLQSYMAMMTLAHRPMQLLLNASITICS